MTEEEERQRNAKTLLEFAETKKSLAGLKEDAIAYATIFEEVAGKLRTNPANLVSFITEIPTLQDIKELATKIQGAEAALARLGRTKHEMGFPD